MKIFLDSADLTEIKYAKKSGMLDGITTNPSLIKKAVEKYKGKISLEKYIQNILQVDKKIPVSLEVVGDNYEEMIKEGKIIFKKFKKYGNIVIKIPVNPCMEKKCSHSSDGIRAIKTLSQLRIPINCTLIFTPEQALLAAKAGAKMVSPFLGREDDFLKETFHISSKKYIPPQGFKKGKKLLDDDGIVSGIDLLKECRDILKKNKMKTEVLAASIRTKRQFREAALTGADIITIPPVLITELLAHAKTKEGMKKFMRDAPKEYKRLLKK